MLGKTGSWWQLQLGEEGLGGAHATQCIDDLQSAAADRLMMVCGCALQFLECACCITSHKLKWVSQHEWTGKTCICVSDHDREDTQCAECSYRANAAVSLDDKSRRIEIVKITHRIWRSRTVWRSLPQSNLPSGTASVFWGGFLSASKHRNQVSFIYQVVPMSYLGIWLFFVSVLCKYILKSQLTERNKMGFWSVEWKINTSLHYQKKKNQMQV